MPVRQRVVLCAFVVWSVFVWGNRISNTLRSDESTVSKTFSTVLSIVLLASAVAVLAVTVRAWRGVVRDWGGKVLLTAGLVTVVVWLVRIPQIALADHDAGFVIVHVVLGLISIALAVPVARIGAAARRAARPRPPI
ncbi:MAG: hypothetical protein FGM58_08970 [Acidimicrobiia bacterium]|nr:hypothetical protein [Acidimicrobiia bacterium]